MLKDVGEFSEEGEAAAMPGIRISGMMPRAERDEIIPTVISSGSATTDMVALRRRRLAASKTR
jgi:hypothetical protein